MLIVPEHLPHYEIKILLSDNRLAVFPLFCLKFLQHLALVMKNLNTGKRTNDPRPRRFSWWGPRPTYRRFGVSSRDIKFRSAPTSSVTCTKHKTNQPHEKAKIRLFSTAMWKRPCKAIQTTNPNAKAS